MRLSLKPAPLPVPDPSREARDKLGAAIERVAGLKVECAKAEDAARKAKGHRFAAQERLESLAESKNSRDPAVAFINSIESGAPVDVIELTGADDREVARLRAEIAAWDATAGSATKLAERLREDIDLAERIVDGRVGEVMAIDGLRTVLNALENAERLHADLIRARAILGFFNNNRLIGDDAMRQRVREILSFRDFPTIAQLETFATSCDDHPINQRLEAARKALRTDPEAAVPDAK